MPAASTDCAVRFATSAANPVWLANAMSVGGEPLAVAAVASELRRGLKK